MPARRTTKSPKSELLERMLVLILWILSLAFMIYILLLMILTSTISRTLLKKKENTIFFNIVREDGKINFYDMNSNKITMGNYLKRNSKNVLVEMINNVLKKGNDSMQVMIKNNEEILKIYDNRSLLVMILPLNEKIDDYPNGISTMNEFSALCKSVVKISAKKCIFGYDDFLDCVSVYLYENVSFLVYLTSEFFIIELKNGKRRIFSVDVPKYLSDVLGAKIESPKNQILLIIYRVGIDNVLLVNMDRGATMHGVNLPIYLSLVKRTEDSELNEKRKRLYNFDYEKYIDSAKARRLVEMIKHSEIFNDGINDVLDAIYKKRAS